MQIPHRHHPDCAFRSRPCDVLWHILAIVGPSWPFAMQQFWSKHVHSQTALEEEGEGVLERDLVCQNTTGATHVHAVRSIQQPFPDATSPLQLPLHRDNS
jgi:hypothetical protein